MLYNSMHIYIYIYIHVYTCKGIDTIVSSLHNCLLYDMLLLLL